MPELPEVEVTRQGIEPWLLGQSITHIDIRHPKLRWPVPAAVLRAQGQVIQRVLRRGKYLLLETGCGTIILHLGMSGNLRVLPIGTAPNRHDHLDIALANGKLLRLHDPRRFGAVLWHEDSWDEHPLLASLGPEPLSIDFDADYLRHQCKGRRVAIKPLLMDSKVVVGVGNIYANEALFMAQIAPFQQASALTQWQAQVLVSAIKATLSASIAQGGTTLKDFLKADGKPGYFALSLKVYGRDGEPCPECGTLILKSNQGQRSTFYCQKCQVD